jgi:hypothetical protein
MRARFIVPITAVIALPVTVGFVLVATLDGGDGEDVGARVLLAAGDIAECPTSGDEATARILSRYPGATIATLGDNAYPDGATEDFERCYDPSWGRYKDRTRPATGNHDFGTTDAEGYFDYFGKAGGDFDKYYYSYDLGAWHVVVLNSDCWRVGGCEINETQAEWLRRDLRNHGALCTLAYWHRPPFSSGRYGDPEDTGRVRPLWRVLYEEGADVLLTGHEHSYERFAPMNADGERDEQRGVRLIVVGTGGGNLRRFKYDPLPTTEVRNDETWGVVKLTLYPTRYKWEFIPVAGTSFTDSGSGVCH